MILKYKFTYLSNNNTLINFLTNIAEESAIEYVITRDENEIDFYINAHEEELLSFADKLSADLPMSIFLKNTSAELAEDMPKSSCTSQARRELNLPFCPKCFKKAEDENASDFYNPFTTCKMCADTKSIHELIITSAHDVKHTDAYKKVFQELATDINEGKKIKIRTLSGVFIFQKLENLKTSADQKNITLLCTNLANISTVVVAKKAEIITLACIEKPQLELRVNELFKSKEILKVQSVSVRYANDLLLYLLSKELIKFGVDFLHYTEDGDYDLSVDFTNFDESETVSIPKVKIVDNDRLVMIDSENYDKKLMRLYHEFKDKNKGHFMVLLYENNLLEKSVLNFYSSSHDDDNIALYSKKFDGFLDILNYKLPKSMHELFEEIERDENGSKLLQNYRNKYSQNYENALNFDISHLDKNSIYSFYKITEVILGLKATVLSGAASCLLEKGPRIDYKFIESDTFYGKKFNYVKLIKSGMSFRLAGVDDNTISLGYIESYTHFISNIVDEVNNQTKLDGISLCGDLFANETISRFVHKSITKNFKMYYNKDFVIQVM